MMSLLENLAFVGFVSAILYVLYWSVRNDDKGGKRKGKTGKFDLQRARDHARRRNKIPVRKETSE